MTNNNEGKKSVKDLKTLDITVDKIDYDQSSKRLSIDLEFFTFLGHYGKSTTLKTILKDLRKALENFGAAITIITVKDLWGVIVDDALKLKDIDFDQETPAEPVQKQEIIMEKQVKKKKIAPSKGKRRAAPLRPTPAPPPPGAPAPAPERIKMAKLKEEPAEMDEEVLLMEESEEEAMGFSDLLSESSPEVASSASIDMRKEAQEAPSMTPQRMMESAPPTPPPVPQDIMSAVSSTGETKRKRKTYEINMGLQYYSVMMEQKSYLFYVYFSHDELIIEDEEGKTVYKTSFTITTTKKEPPVFDLRIEGEGFEIHPLSGKVMVKKKSINPPVMIFSVMPVKQKKKEKKKKDKKGESRYLHIVIDFEGETVSHTILTITVQPKFFKLKLGPIQLNLSKVQAMIISIISMGITAISAIYSILTLDISSSSSGAFSGILPGAGSLLFLGMFLYTLLKKGVFPLKQQVSGLMNMDAASLMK